MREIARGSLAWSVPGGRAFGIVEFVMTFVLSFGLGLLGLAALVGLGVLVVHPGLDFFW
jgi:hypothetical protein